MSAYHPVRIYSALTEGKGRLSVDTEIILYGILDVVSSSHLILTSTLDRLTPVSPLQLAKVVFGFYLLIAHSHTEGDSVSWPVVKQKRCYSYMIVLLQVVLSSFFTEPRNGAGYGAIGQDDD
jgi:hypothetical protein